MFRENVLSGEADIAQTGQGGEVLVFEGVQHLREVFSQKISNIHEEGEIPPRRMKLTVIAYIIYTVIHIS